MNVREVGFRSILQDDEGMSGTEMVRKMIFLAGSVEEERCAQRTIDTCQHASVCPYHTTQDIKAAVRTYPLGSLAARTLQRWNCDCSDSSEKQL